MKVGCCRHRWGEGSPLQKTSGCDTCRPGIQGHGIQSVSTEPAVIECYGPTDGYRHGYGVTVVCGCGRGQAHRGRRPEQVRAPGRSPSAQVAKSFPWRGRSRSRNGTRPAPGGWLRTEHTPTTCLTEADDLADTECAPETTGAGRGNPESQGRQGRGQRGFCTSVAW